MKACAVCSHGSCHRIHAVKEMTTGTREIFHYQECSACGYLELLDIPKDMSAYYASNYYSFGDQNFLKSYLKALRGAHGFGSRNPLGAMLAKVFGYPPIVHFLKRIAAKTSWRILDVGCGLGIALRDLGFAGFAALDGVDPHLDRTKSIGSVKLFKMDFSEVTETYDLVIFNHSFEHMLNQLEVLTQAAHVLADDGWLLIRMPVVGKSWRQYKCDWFCLHAPRHFSIHTLKSFHKQLLRSPFEIVYLDFDSDWNHNLSSKKYALDIPNSDPRYLKNTGLLPKDFEDAKSEALLANQLGEGDQASFYLRKKSAKLNSGKSPA